ncbi:hypothetical protein AJ79_09337 [Helicocarpus griseus UAMH5409]|uniref:GTP-binding protein ypt4 n=1 Tax=Helicocarpus griseus UAMH5409 TaxID=1447875 RepID=A0A2B7WKQ4_9EURO|nr:hypothetical protein AJ79_09337 [Helicocarpus griseus UAMH5409]
MSQPWDYIAKLVCIGDSGTGKSSLTIRLCEGRFSATHDVTIGVEFGSRIVPVGPPASDALGIDFDRPPSPSSPSAHLPVIPPNRSHSHSPTSAQISMNGDDHTKRKQQAQQHQQKQKEPAPAGLPSPPRKQQPPPVQKRMKLSLWDTAGQETYKSITRSYFRGASGALLVFDITRPATFTSLTQWLQDLRQIAEEGIVVILVGNKSDLANVSQDNSNDNSFDQQSRGVVTREEAEAWCRTNNVSRYVETSAKSGEGVERAFLEVAERIYRNIEAGRYDLNDRRSGVKGFGAMGGGTGGGGRMPRTVTLGVNDAMERRGGGCC